LEDNLIMGIRRSSVLLDRQAEHAQKLLEERMAKEAAFLRETVRPSMEQAGQTLSRLPRMKAAQIAALPGWINQIISPGRNEQILREKQDHRIGTLSFLVVFPRDHHN
jgi:hypothetical protein